MTADADFEPLAGASDTRHKKKSRNGTNESQKVPSPSMMLKRSALNAAARVSFGRLGAGRRALTTEGTLPLESLTAISAADGRYGKATAPLREHFSEYGLIRARVAVEW